MKRSLSVVLALIFVCTFAVAQDMPGQGSKAFFGYYSGGANGIGLRYWLQPGLVLVPSVNFSINNNTTKGAGGSSDATNNTTTFGIAIGAESHMAPIGPVSPFFEGGLTLTSSSNTVKPSQAAGTPANGTTLETNTSSTPFGVFGGLGLEAFIDKGVSVGFSYRVNVSFGGGKTTQKTQGNPDVTGENSTFGISLASSNIWLSIFF